MSETHTPHPANLAINLHRECVQMKVRRETLRAEASELRRQAKTAVLKADAFAMRARAKPLSDEAQAIKAQMCKTNKAFLEHAQQAHALLTKRMPECWCHWGVIKTRAYATCLDIVAVQLQRVHPAPSVVATALQHILAHENWSDHVMAHLAITKTNSKEIPLN